MRFFLIGMMNGAIMNLLGLHGWRYWGGFGWVMIACVLYYESMKRRKLARGVWSE